jgi:hypothetical protein
MIEKQILESLYIEEFNSLDDIARLYSVTKTTIARWMKVYGIKTRPPGLKKLFFENEKNLSLTEKQKEFIVGSLLGDGHVSLGRKSARLEINHSFKQVEYLKWKKAIMGGFSNDIYNYNVVLQGKKHKVCGLKTKSHTEFLEFRDMFYNKQVKHISEDVVKYFSDLSLAVLIMDDGTLKCKRNIIVCSNCFDFNDHVIIKNILERKFKVRPKIIKARNNQLNLWFNKYNSKRISDIVYKHFIKEMRYKLPL